MKRKKAIEYLGCSKVTFKDLIRMSHFVNRGPGYHHDYTTHELKIFKRFLDAREEWRKAKFLLTNGRKHRSNKHKKNGTH